jgi:hypothetical protein
MQKLYTAGWVLEVLRFWVLGFAGSEGLLFSLRTAKPQNPRTSEP